MNYDNLCNQCGEEFIQNMPLEDYKKGDKFECPACGSKDITQLESPLCCQGK